MKPEVKEAYRQFAKAKRHGIIIPARNCEDCGQIPLKIHGHHEDYLKPLAVNWLCFSCHRRRHKKYSQQELSLRKKIGYMPPFRTDERYFKFPLNGSRLQKFRLDIGLNEEKFLKVFKITDLTVEQLKKVEKRKRNSIDYGWIHRISKRFNIPIKEFE